MAHGICDGGENLEMVQPDGIYILSSSSAAKGFALRHGGIDGCMLVVPASSLLLIWLPHAGRNCSMHQYHAAANIHTYIHTYMHTYIHMHMYIYTYVHIYICVCVCMFVCMCVLVRGYEALLRASADLRGVTGWEPRLQPRIHRLNSDAWIFTDGHGRRERERQR